MKTQFVKAAVAALFGGSMMIAAGVAGAAQCSYGGIDGVNSALAAGGASGSYTGSCEGGARCFDSVATKNASACDKASWGKLADAKLKLCAIKADAGVWAAAAKPKLDATGFGSLTEAVDAVLVELGQDTRCAQ